MAGNKRHVMQLKNTARRRWKSAAPPAAALRLRGSIRIHWAAALTLMPGLAFADTTAPQRIRLTEARAITSSATIAPGIYTIPDPENDGSVVISADDVTVDFSGATLLGGDANAPADQFTGRGIVVRGNNVTLRNARVHGFKIGIFAEDAPGLTIADCEVSRNYRQKLRSTPQREDLSDWLYGHENDDNEWQRYGAGMYLFRCPKATVMRCRGRNGQNGICLVRCDESHVVDNDLSFMSGWGLAMWRSSRCDVFNNKFDWCIRGYSHGVYSRGQDSAGILVYEQCKDNVFAFNSATHGGDGFFLYAGNETLRKSGSGGCNGNLVYKNDFSHAVANGIEATFSDGNLFVENILDECDHGVWAGYSSNTLIEQNTIRWCKNGVSIEHGTKNAIVGNTMEDSSVGVHLWWDRDEDLLSSPFCAPRDLCPSERNSIRGNTFRRVGTALRLRDDARGSLLQNRFEDVNTTLETAGVIDGWEVVMSHADCAKARHESPPGPECRETGEKEPPDVADWKAMFRARELRRGKQRTFRPPGSERGRRFIYLDEWGPYDFAESRISPADVSGGERVSFNLLTPPDTPFVVKSASEGVAVIPKTGTAPLRLTVETARLGVTDFRVEIEAGERTFFSTGTLFRGDWHVEFRRWSDATDPRGPDENWKTIMDTTDGVPMTLASVDFVWGHGAPTSTMPADRFATWATTTVKLPQGRWRISTVSDDGVRVFIDEKQVLSNWTQHGPTTDETVVALNEGDHRIRVEHFEIDGFAQLQFLLARAAASGTPDGTGP